ncbi:hypothetical protein BDM02DRAFT_1857809 [Thelephora ganbajun]|uniref:Uncharacterized protein n=1 Tax=Thelephora ganbajun TaxID=370292 RepID=A0ACB6YZZ1_THEGA|nr:hypothetical protein BDM02DRAFT_1857809 [Thelephora ganbajun]
MPGMTMMMVRYAADLRPYLRGVDCVRVVMGNATRRDRNYLHLFVRAMIRDADPLSFPPNGSSLGACDVAQLSTRCVDRPRPSVLSDTMSNISRCRV